MKRILKLWSGRSKKISLLQELMMVLHYIGLRRTTLLEYGKQSKSLGWDES